MKLYHVFAGDDYYPYGFNDYRASFDTFDEAYAWIVADHSRGRHHNDWYEVIESREDGLVQVGDFRSDVDLPKLST